MAQEVRISVEHVDMIFGSYVVQRDVSFKVGRGEVFVIMGGSGCGKSTMLRHMIGLVKPAGGRIVYDGTSFWDVDQEGQRAVSRRFGVLFQSGALWSSMTLAENVALPLAQYTSLNAREIADVVSLKLALVGCAASRNTTPRRSAVGCASARASRARSPSIPASSSSTSRRPASIP